MKAKQKQTLMRGRSVAFGALGLLMTASALTSCSQEDSPPYYSSPLALVTVRPADGFYTMQLDDSTVLVPCNRVASPFGDKTVRALLCYTDMGPDEICTSTGQTGKVLRRNVGVEWMDSIRTKLPVASQGDRDSRLYGNDPIEIVRDWVTVAEDGFLTLRIRTRWGGGQQVHYMNLLTGVNADNAYEMELRHDAKGDTKGPMGDALIAFDLNSLPRPSGDDVKIKLNWTSFEGRKSAEFSLHLHSQPSEGVEQLPLSSRVK